MPEVLDAADSELTVVAQWYDRRRAGYDHRFLDEVLAVFDAINAMPLSGAPWILEGIPEGIRHIALWTFSESIVYVTEPRVVVVANMGSQEPTYWTDRLDGI